MRSKLLLNFSLLLTITGYSQLFVNYGVEHGLEAKYIYDISQNEQLSLILATEKGLFKYDGYEYVKIDLPAQNIRSYVSKLYRSQDKKLFAGNSIGEVWLEKKGRFFKINLQEESNSQ